MGDDWLVVCEQDDRRVVVEALREWNAQSPYDIEVSLGGKFSDFLSKDINILDDTV